MKLSVICLPITLAATLAFSPACLAQTAPQTPVQASPAPAPNTAPTDPYAAILGPEVKVLGYGVRPPKDFTPTQMPGPIGRVRNFAWQGAIHQDGSVTTFVVGIYRPSVPEPNPEREFMIGIFKGLSRTLTNTAMSPSQPGTVGGLPAQRATWTGVRATRHARLTMQGFIYIVQDGAILISIAGADTVPAFTTTFPMLNSAALSLHK